MGDLSPQTSRALDPRVSSSISPFVTAGDAPASFVTLPTEIRIMIWEACFPPRQDFDLRPPHRFNKWQRRKLPITLWINQESREETLRNYVFEVLKGNDMGEIQILCFRPGYDILYFDVLRYKRHVEYSWLRDCLHRHPEWFNRVHTLEIRAWQCAPKDLYDKIDHMQASFASDCIVRFPNLRNLKILEDYMIPYFPSKRQAYNDAAESKRCVARELQHRFKMAGAGRSLSGLNIFIQNRLGAVYKLAADS